MATPTTTPTPTSGTYTAESIKVDFSELVLKVEKSSSVTVTVAGEDDCRVEGKTVTREITSGNEYVSVSPTTNTTDANGQAQFTVTAKNNPGNADIVFKADGLNKTASVSVLVIIRTVIQGYVINATTEDPIVGATISQTQPMQMVFINLK